MMHVNFDLLMTYLEMSLEGSSMNAVLEADRTYIILKRVTK